MLALAAAFLMGAGAFAASAPKPPKKPTVSRPAKPPSGATGAKRPVSPNTEHRKPTTAPLTPITVPTLVWTGEQNGHLEPCGCAKPQLGGMLRRAGFLRAALKGPSLRVDNGNLTAARGRQDELKAETSIQLLNQLGYAAINLGEAEFRLGLPYLQYLASSFKGAFLSANARNEADQPYFQEYVVRPLQVDGREVRVALVGLISERYAPEAEALNPGLKIAPAGDTLDRLRSTLEPHDLVVLLFHGEPDEARQLVTGQEWISAVIPAHAPEDRAGNQAKPGETPLLTVGRDGKYLGLAEIAPPSTPGGRAALRNARGLALGPEMPEDEAARSIEKLYLQRVADERLLDKLPRQPLADGERFAGTASCKSCHAGAHKTWAASTHAKAWETLVQVGHDKNPDCVGCHVVGLEFKGGFTSAKETPHLEDVGCESCHGAAGRHAANPGAVRPPKVGAASCASCHVPDHSPGFDFAKFWAKIRH